MSLVFLLFSACLIALGARMSFVTWKRSWSPKRRVSHPDAGGMTTRKYCACGIVFFIAMVLARSSISTQLLGSTNLIAQYASAGLFVAALISFVFCLRYVVGEVILTPLLIGIMLIARKIRRR